jgi:hypothetical protein
MPTNRIMQEWEEFAGAVMPPDPAGNQVQEMRRAFFGGAFAMLSLMMSIASDDVDEDAGVILIDEAKIECLDFVKRIATGEF